MKAKKAVIAALIGNGLICLIKFITSFLSKSASMTAESLHSLADTFNQIFLLIGIKLQKKPPDAEHPFGYGKERYFWTFITAVMIFAMGGLLSFYEGINKIVNPHPIRYFNLSLIVISLALIFEIVSFTIAIQEVLKGAKASQMSFIRFLRKTSDTTIKTVVFEDFAAILGLVIAGIGLFLSQKTGLLYYDGFSSILIGLVLIVMAYFLGSESRQLLLGKAASIEIRQEIIDLIKSREIILEIKELLTMQLSPEEILVTGHILLKPNMTSKKIAVEIDNLEKEIKKRVPSVSKIFFEADKKGLF